MNAEREEVGVGLFQLNISGEQSIRFRRNLYKSKEGAELNRYSQ